MPTTPPSKHRPVARPGKHQADGSRRRGARPGPLDGFALLLLLVAPALAIHRLAGLADYRWLLGGAMVISVVTYLIFAFDKRRAEAGGWRVSESSLHLLELLGGWPGAFMAQRGLRHKSSKRAYQITFWTIVGVHQLVALDLVLNWAMTRRIWEAVTVLGG